MQWCCLVHTRPHVQHLLAQTVCSLSSLLKPLFHSEYSKSSSSHYCVLASKSHHSSKLLEHTISQTFQLLLNILSRCKDCQQQTYIKCRVNNLMNKASSMRNIKNNEDIKSRYSKRYRLGEVSKSKSAHMQNLGWSRRYKNTARTITCNRNN